MKEKNYLTEAFQALADLELNEDVFTVTDAGIEDANDFIKEDEVNEFEDIIDPLAETEEELKDSYLGKAILDCEVCHSKLYKDPEEVVIDEEAQLANIEEACPYCQSNEGFKVIGQVAEYCPHCDHEDEEHADTEIDIDEKEDEIESEEKIDESIKTKTSIIPLNEDNFGAFKVFYSELFDYEVKFIPASSVDKTIDRWLATAESILFKDREDKTGRKLEAVGYFEKDNDGYFLDELILAPWASYDEVLSSVYSKFEELSTSLYESIKTKKGMRKMSSLKEEDKPAATSIEDAQKWVDYDMKKYGRISGKTNRLVKKAGFQIIKDDHGDYEVTAGKFESCNRGKINKSLKENVDDPAEIIGNGNLDRGYEIVDDIIFKLIKKYNKLKDLSFDDRWQKCLDDSVNIVSSLYDVSRDQAESICEYELMHLEDEINESLLKEDTNSDSTKDALLDSIAFLEDLIRKEKKNIELFKPFIGDPDIRFDAKEEVESSEDRIKHLEKEIEERKVIYSNYLNEEVEKVNIETDSDRVTMEQDENGKVVVTTEPKETMEVEETEEIIAPVEPETEEKFEVEGEEDFEEVDFDEFEETDFDTLGEKYLKRVYENVKSFKTTKGSLKGNKLQLEGLITFKSGKKAKTNFIFEAHTVSKTGKLKFLGENKQFAKGKKSFTLTGSKQGNKLMMESLTYNYRAKDAATNESQRLYGRVSK